MKSFIKHRPKQLLAVYIEPHQIDILRARRKWRSWEIDSVEQFPVPDGEAIYDSLQRLNLRPRSKGNTALVLFLPRLYYGFHREHYPASLENNLEEALAFDWPENVFQEPEQSFHFSSKAMTVNHHLSVPIFSLRHDIYEKFYQAMGGGNFQTFNVLPTALNYRVFLDRDPMREEASEIEIFGRTVDSSHLEVHKFYKGFLLDSVIIRNDEDQLRLFRESLRSLNGTEPGEAVSIRLICQPNEYNRAYVTQWRNEDLPFEMFEVESPLLSLWIEDLLRQDSIQTFNPPLILKPWEVPKAAYVIIAIILGYSLYAFYQVNAYDSLLQTSHMLKRQRAQLEAQWKPIEQLQNRIGKFQEDQKALAQFGNEGYPMLGILTLLTEVTPQDTWLNYLSLRQGELMLRGESTSAIKYLTELSKVKGFEDVRFASPVTRNPSSDMERFNLQIRLNQAVLQRVLEAIPLEGAVVEIPRKGEGNTQTASSQPPTATPPQTPKSKPPDEKMGVLRDDNETATVMSPPPADDNSTLNQNIE